MYYDKILFRSRSAEKSEPSSRLLSQILEELQDLPNGVLVVACSNIPSVLDAALMRRFKQWFQIPLPDVQCREKILDSLFKGMN